VQGYCTAADEEAVGEFEEGDESEMLRRRSELGLQRRDLRSGELRLVLGAFEFHFGGDEFFLYFCWCEGGKRFAKTVEID